MRNSKPSQPISGPGCLFHFCRAVFSITFEYSGMCVDMCNFGTSVCGSGESEIARIRRVLAWRVVLVTKTLFLL